MSIPYAKSIEDALSHRYLAECESKARAWEFERMVQDVTADRMKLFQGCPPVRTAQELAWLKAAREAVAQMESEMRELINAGVQPLPDDKEKDV